MKSPQKNKKGLTREQAIARVAAIKAEMEQAGYALMKIQESNRCYYFKPYKWHKRALELIHAKPIVVVPAPNKIGKTALVACLIASWVLGYEPWNVVSADYPGAVKVKDVYYGPSSLGKKPPVRIRITGEDWLVHLGQTVIPELKKWLPAGTYETKKNNQGVEHFWTFKGGSTLELLTHDQDDKLFESWLGDAWIPDEPPPHTKYSAMARGLFLTGGKIVMMTTPLREAWILDNLVLSGRRDIGTITDLTILDNEDLLRQDTAVLLKVGLNGGQIDHYFKELLTFKKMEPWLEGIVGPDKMDELVNSLKVAKVINDTKEDERDARIFGKFKSLVGLILKEYNPDVHLVKPFEVPTDWPVTCLIDIHLNKPQALLFVAWDRQDRMFCIHEVWENLSPEAIADTIIRLKNRNSWRMEECFIDPLAKGDSAFVRNRQVVEDSFTIIDGRLKDHDMWLTAASKDKDSGIRNVKDRLKGVNGMASLFFFDNLVRTPWECSRWVYDENGKPKKENDHMMENLYRATLSGIEWTEPQDFNKPLKLVEIS